MIEINEYGQLVALHRTLVAAKFVTNGIDPDVPTSPVVADICNQVYDSILELLANDADPKEYLEWENWRKLNSTRREIQIVKHFISRSAFWRGLDVSDQKKHVEILLSPYIVDSTIMEELLQYGNLSSDQQ